MAQPPINPDPALRSVGLDPAKLPKWDPSIAPTQGEVKGTYAEWLARSRGEAGSDPKDDRQAAQFDVVQQAADNAGGQKDPTMTELPVYTMDSSGAVKRAPGNTVTVTVPIVGPAPMPTVSPMRSPGVSPMVVGGAGGGGGLVVLGAMALLGGGGLYFYLRRRKGKKGKRAR